MKLCIKDKHMVNLKKGGWERVKLAGCDDHHSSRIICVAVCPCLHWTGPLDKEPEVVVKSLNAEIIIINICYGGAAGVAAWELCVGIRVGGG